MKPTKNFKKIEIVIKYLREPTSRNSMFPDTCKSIEMVEIRPNGFFYKTFNRDGVHIGNGFDFRDASINALKGKYLKHLEQGHFKEEPCMKKMINYIEWIGGTQ